MPSLHPEHEYDPPGCMWQEQPLTPKQGTNKDIHEGNYIHKTTNYTDYNRFPIIIWADSEPHQFYFR
jgi:hypothetical protein